MRPWVGRIDGISRSLTMLPLKHKSGARRMPNSANMSQINLIITPIFLVLFIAENYFVPILRGQTSGSLLLAHICIHSRPAAKFHGRKAMRQCTLARISIAFEVNKTRVPAQPIELVIGVWSTTSWVP
jgi:hypothetical protein